MNRFEKSFQQFHVWNPVHPPPNYSQIQLYLFSIKILKIILKFNSFWRSNDGINFNQLSFKINKNSISHVINSRLIIVDNVNASSILDNGTSAKKNQTRSDNTDSHGIKPVEFIEEKKMESKRAKTHRRSV